MTHIRRHETKTIRARAFIPCSLNFHHRHIIPFKFFSVQKKVSFHRHYYAWLQATVSSVDSFTITVAFEGKLYPTHQSRVRPLLGEMSILPALEEDQHTHDHPASTRKVTLPDLMNSFLVSLLDSCQKLFDSEIERTSCFVSIFQRDIFDTDSDSVFLTATKVFIGQKSIPEPHLASFGKAKLEEINFSLIKICEFRSRRPST